MDLASTFNIITSVIVTLGGSSVVVFGLSGWLNEAATRQKKSLN